MNKKIYPISVASKRKYYETHKQKRIRLKSEGCCIVCGIKRESKNAAYCNVHATYYRDYARNYAKNRFKNPETKVKLTDEVKLQYRCQNPNCPVKVDLPAYCYDYHHIDPSGKAFSIGAGQRSREKTVEEINKCTVVCAVCHRMETWGDLDMSKFPKCQIE